MDDIEALARIAERYERMILHEAGNGFDTFTVADDGVLYQYVAEAEFGEGDERPPAPAHGFSNPA